MHLKIIFLAITFSPLALDAKLTRTMNYPELDSLRELRPISPDRAIRYARSILDSLNVDDRDLESRVMHSLGEIYLEIGLPYLALTNFIDSNNKSLAKSNPWNSISIGNVYASQEHWFEAKNKYYQALDIFSRRSQEAINNINGKAVALNCLGNVELNLKHYDDALVFYKEALDVRRGSAKYKAFQRSLSTSSPSFIGAGISVAYQHRLLAKLYADWGIDEMALEQLYASDSLLAYESKSKINGDKINSINRRRYVYLGNNHSLKMVIYARQNNFYKVSSESKSALKYLENIPVHLAEHKANIAEIKIIQDSLYAALESIDNALKICELNGLSVQEIKYLEKKIEILTLNNLDKSALDASNILVDKKQVLSDDRMDMLLESLIYKSKYEKNRKKLKDARSRELFMILISGIIMLLFGTIVLSYRNRRRSASQEALIHKQARQLVESDLKIKESELIKMSANIVSKNDLLSSIDKDLAYHSSLIDNKADRKVLDPLRKKIKNKIDDSADWENFQIQFSLAYPEFVDELVSSYDDLRSNDIKLCCYLKMSMNTKEIAMLTGLSVRAVENKRYRLRKKLKLDTDISLESFIHSFKINKNYL
tara:strand:+ start:1388 stop:3181 length:1794 start_codon:yes stop_codon:yes gene_type:complete